MGKLSGGASDWRPRLNRYFVQLRFTFLDELHLHPSQPWQCSESIEFRSEVGFLLCRPVDGACWFGQRRRYRSGQGYQFHLPPVVGELPPAIQTNHIRSRNCRCFRAILARPGRDRKRVALMRATEQYVHQLHWPPHSGNKQPGSHLRLQQAFGNLDSSAGGKVSSSGK